MNDAALDRRLRDGVVALAGGPGANPDWEGVLRAAADTPARPPALRRFASRLPRGRYVAALAVAGIALGATFASPDWITTQFGRFRGSNFVDMRGAVVVAHLRQHDGSSREIAEKVVPATAKTPAMRCGAIRPPAPADPVAAPSDPLSFAGSAFCTDPSTMAFESTWQDDGSVALLARRADKADGIELRVGSTSWTPSSADGPWALFTLPAGSVSRDATVELVALGADGSAVATEDVDWRTGPASGTRKPVAGAP